MEELFRMGFSFYIICVFILVVVYCYASYEYGEESKEYRVIQNVVIGACTIIIILMIGFLLYELLKSMGF